MSTQMSSACDDHETKRAHTAARGWSATFPDDLLAVVYSMVASPLSRTRFAAVCRSWRAAALAVPPLPALPWLLLSPRDGSGTEALYCPDDCAVVRLRVPREDAGRWIIGGHDGGWVAFHMPCLVKIINIFSGAEVGLSTIVCPSRHHALGHLVFISRVVFSAPPNSPQCILAAVTYNCGIALCRVASPNNGWTVQGCPNNRRFVDITFCNGELYCLNGKRKIVKFEIRVDDDGCPLVTAEHRLVMPRIDREIRMDNVNASYIFDLNGKLAMALKTRWLPNIRPFFKVFQLVDSTGKQQARYKHRWLEVTSLGDQALFLGKLFSKAVHVPANICGSVERNHIYYSQYCLLGENSIIASDRVVLKISNDISGMICYKEDDSKNSSTDNDIKRIMSVGYFVQGYLHGGMWILPPDI